MGARVPTRHTDAIGCSLGAHRELMGLLFGFPFIGYSWVPSELPLGSCWLLTGFPLGSHWAPFGVWGPAGHPWVGAGSVPPELHQEAFTLTLLFSPPSPPPPGPRFLFFNFLH